MSESNPDFYYWKYVGKRKYYYLVSGDINISKKNIDPRIVDQIKFRNNDNIISELEAEYEGLTQEFNRIKNRMNEVANKLEKLRKDPSSEELKARADAAEREQKAKEKAKQRQQKRKDEYSNNHQPSYEQPINPKQLLDKLVEYKIYTRDDWKGWLKVNHPDKGGNLETVQDVNRLAALMEWCK